MNFRKTAPPLREIQNIKWHQNHAHTLHNGIPLYEVNIGTQDILKFDILLHAGRWQESKELVSRVTAQLMKEGTQNHSSAEIAETIDFYGGTLRIGSSLDITSVSLFCLSKHFDRLLELTHEILTSPTFPDKEFNNFKQFAKQRLQIEATKSDVIAYRKITEMMFGAEHPYGYNSTAKAYDQITRNDLLTHFKDHYHSGNCKIMVSGKTTPQVIEKIDSLFGRKFAAGKFQPIQHQPTPDLAKNYEGSLPGSVQSSIRIGFPFVGRKHPDYHGFYVLNTIFGGYFGSRLMSNIREDKGYTYGIYSSIDSMLNGSYFYIATETSHKFAAPTEQEIMKETKRIKEEPISDEELTRCRNYLLGNILSSLDGPLNVAGLNKMLILEDLDFGYMERLVHKIKTIDQKELMALANKYFVDDDYYRVVIN